MYIINTDLWFYLETCGAINASKYCTLLCGVNKHSFSYGGEQFRCKVCKKLADIYFCSGCFDSHYWIRGADQTPQLIYDGTVSCSLLYRMFRSMIQSRGRGAGFVSHREAARQDFPILGIDQCNELPSPINELDILRWILCRMIKLTSGHRHFFNMTWSLFTTTCSHQAVAIASDCMLSTKSSTHIVLLVSSRDKSIREGIDICILQGSLQVRILQHKIANL